MPRRLDANRNRDAGFNVEDVFIFRSISALLFDIRISMEVQDRNEVLILKKTLSDSTVLAPTKK